MISHGHHAELKDAGFTDMPSERICVCYKRRRVHLEHYTCIWHVRVCLQVVVCFLWFVWHQIIYPAHAQIITGTAIEKDWGRERRSWYVLQCATQDIRSRSRIERRPYDAPGRRCQRITALADGPQGCWQDGTMHVQQPPAADNIAGRRC
jgi:hypothetical protein